MEQTIVREQPRYRLTYAVPLEDYMRANTAVGLEIAGKAGRRWVVIGCFMAMFALGFLAYIIFAVRVWEPLYYLLAVLLLLLGVYNILYYPVLYPRTLPHKVERNYRQSTYLQKPITLLFYSDYIEEQSANGCNRLQWQSVRAVRETPALYVVMLTKYGGLIIPKSQVPKQEQGELDQILRTAQERFGKQRIIHAEH